MFYKVRNLCLIALFCFLAVPVQAQGLVSLSEEAMFDDGLDTGDELPDFGAPKTPAVPAKSSTVDSKDASLIQPQAAPKAPQPQAETPSPAAAAGQPAKEDGRIDLFGGTGDEPVAAGSDLFSQMSELEKRTAVLNLELRREKLQNEIEAVKNQRRQALQQEQDKIEQQRLKNIEFEKEQEKKVLIEQQKLRDLDIQFETLRQEKLLDSYKNYMLEENQKWIAHNASFYKQISDLRQSKKQLAESLKNKMLSLQNEAKSARRAYNTEVASYQKEINDLQAQISVLRNRITTMEKEQEAMAQNPFAGAGSSTATASTTTAGGDSDESIPEEPVETDLSQLYAVTEIRGQGGELIAKLVNKSGTSFYVKKGTTLQTGHVIGDITQTYVAASKGGDTKYLYFAPGGVIPVEATEFKVEGQENNPEGVSAKAPSRTASTGPIPAAL